MRRVTLVSFDIDGTLEVGEPPGIVSIALVRQAKQLGYVIGSCSDRPIGYQEALWERLAIAVDFTVLKHRLADVRARFAAGLYYHIGDTDVDEFFATGAGFRFLRADAAAHRVVGAGALHRAAPLVSDARGAASRSQGRLTDSAGSPGFSRGWRPSPPG